MAGYDLNNDIWDIWVFIKFMVNHEGGIFIKFILGIPLLGVLLIVILLTCAELKYQYDRMTARFDDPHKQPINLLRGWPAPNLLPGYTIREAVETALSDKETREAGLLYGPDPGFEPLRESIAKWLSEFFKPKAGPVIAKRICITGGASQNLGCMLNVYTDPSYTRNIWIIAPAYFLAFRIFEDAGFSGRMRAVPEDEQGLDIEFLRREIGKSEDMARKNGIDRPKYKPQRARAKVYKHIIYCVPSFSNPSSRTMTTERRKQLVKLAREFDALVVCDDVYDVLQWPAENPSNSASTEKPKSTPAEPTLWEKLGVMTEDIRFTPKQIPETMNTAHLARIVDVDRDLDGGTERDGADGFGNVCSNGTFSKIAGPGIRVGWVEGTEKFAYGVSQTGTTCSGGAPSQLTSTYVNQLLCNGALQERIKDVLRPAYASRYNTLMKAITTHLIPLGFQLPQTDRDVVGGYFSWLSLPVALSSAADMLKQRCKDDENVIIAAGSAFEVPGNESVKFEGNIRLCWAWEDEWKLEEGVRRIGLVAKKMIEEAERGEDFVVVAKEGEDDHEFK